MSDSEKQLKEALQLSTDALTLKVAMEDNPPLKRIALEKMDGEPVWVVSVDHDGCWGIVDTSDQSVWFHTSHGEWQEYWFDDRYIYRYKKSIINYEHELKINEITEEKY